ncbi:hypothetical protein M3J09_008164 [Ascochyta lentis]
MSLHGAINLLGANAVKRMHRVGHKILPMSDCASRTSIPARLQVVVMEGLHVTSLRPSASPQRTTAIDCNINEQQRINHSGSSAELYNKGNKRTTQHVKLVCVAPQGRPFLLYPLSFCSCILRLSVET